jgi:hypothetical protein
MISLTGRLPEGIVIEYPSIDHRASDDSGLLPIPAAALTSA